MSQTIDIIFIFLILIILITLLVLTNLRAIKFGAGGRFKNLTENPRSKSEAEVIKILENITKRKFPTVYPDWLKLCGKSLELDGYNAELKLAVEFSGPLHTKWTPSLEPYEKYFERIVRDIAKKKLCADHGVGLIVLDFSLPSRHWTAYIKSRLYDLKYVENKPIDYIDEQIIKPYRNKHLEKELKLELDKNHETSRSRRKSSYGVS